MSFLMRSRNFFFMFGLFILVSAYSAVKVRAEVENIGNSKLQALTSRGVTLVDIREETEWKDTGIIPNSALITFFDSAGKYDSGKWMDDLKKIAKVNDPVIIICRSGRRSLIVANYLFENENYKTVYNVKDGIKGWKHEKYETVTFE